MGKPNYSPKQRKQRESNWLKMKDFFARRDADKCYRQQKKEYKGDE